MGHLIKLCLLGIYICWFPLVYTPREESYTSSWRGVCRHYLVFLWKLEARLLPSIYRLTVWLGTPAHLIYTMASLPWDCYHCHLQLWSLEALSVGSSIPMAQLQCVSVYGYFGYQFLLECDC